MKNTVSHNYMLYEKIYEKIAVSFENIADVDIEDNNLNLIKHKNYLKLLKQYPQLKKYPEYLYFLLRTGGFAVEHNKFSLGIYGFYGYTVKCFEEGNPLEKDRYFIFGDVL